MSKKSQECFWNMEKEEFLAKADPMKIMLLVSQIHRRKTEKLLGGTGLHRAQHRLLMTLADKEMYSQTELARKLEVSTATVAVSLKKLERDGYIQRTSKEGDSRVNFVQLTAKGKEIVSKSGEIFESIDQQAEKGFADEEIISFRKYLKRVYDNLSEISENENKIMMGGRHEDL